MSTEAKRTAAPTKEDQIAKFLRQLPALRSKKTPQANDSWREVIGTAEGDALDEEAARLGAEWRARMNQSKFG